MVILSVLLTALRWQGHLACKKPTPVIRKFLVEQLNEGQPKTRVQLQNCRWNVCLLLVRLWTTFSGRGWLSGSWLVSINEVTLQWAWLALGWVTVCRWVNHLQTTSLCYQPLRPSQLSTLSGMVNEYRYWPKCGDALWLESTGRYSSFYLWVNVWVAGKTVWSLVNTFCTWAL